MSVSCVIRVVGVVLILASALASSGDDESCALVAAAACANDTTTTTWTFYRVTRNVSERPVQSTSAQPGTFGVALCSAGQALACSSSPASAFILAAGGEDDTPALIAAPYAAFVAGMRGAAVAAWALLATADGSLLNVTDTFTDPGPAVRAAFALPNATSMQGWGQVTRSVAVVKATGAAVGFCSRIALSILPARTLEELDWFAPGLLYGNGSYLPAWAIGGGDRTITQAVVAREDRLAAPLAALVDSAARTVFAVLRPVGAVPNTVLNDTLQSSSLVDERMTFTSVGYERGNESTLLVAAYPGSEYPKTYQAQTPSGQLWRYHPLTAAAPPSTFTVIVAAAQLTPSASQLRIPFQCALDWLWRGALAYYAPMARTDVDLQDAHEAQLASLADTFLAASPLPGVPTGFDKMTGVAYSPVIELGFVGPQLRMAVALLQSALSSGNATRASIAAAMLDGWVTQAGLGYSHAVWNMGETSVDGSALGWWIDDSNSSNGQLAVYLRRQVVSHRHALEAANLLTWFCAAGNQSWPPVALCARRTAWLQWALSLVDVLLLLQQPNGSFARQYSVPTTPGAQPQPTDTSTTATVLPVRYLVEAYGMTTNVSVLDAALRAGEYAWEQYGRYSWYVGAAIDNPDVLDKESSLFAMDSFLALHTATSNATWLDRAAAAALVASTWSRITNVPNPVDQPDMDWAQGDTTVGMGLIATGHSGSDTFDSMFVLPRLHLCALTGDPAVLATTARLALLNTKQPLDLTGRKGYAHRGFMSELFAFSVGWNIFTGINDGRGIGDFHFVPWTSANGAYGVAQLCLSPENEAIIAMLPPQCLLAMQLPPCNSPSQ